MLKKLITTSSFILALANPVYSKAHQTPKTKIEQRLDSLEQKIDGNVEKITTKIDTLDKKIDEIKEPHWYQGPIGYALALVIGIGGLYGYDYRKKRKKIKTHNGVADESFEEKNFDLCIYVLKKALGIDSLDKETNYNLVDALVGKENKLIKNGEGVSEVSDQIKAEMLILKKHDKNDFTPYFFEGNRLFFEGQRESDVTIKKERFDQAFGKYKQADTTYRNKRSGKYWLSELRVELFGKKYSRLSRLYKAMGEILKENKRYDDAIYALEMAKRYKVDDEEIDQLLVETWEEKTQSLNILKTIRVNGEENEW